MKRLITAALALMLAGGGAASAQHLWEVKESSESAVDFFLTNSGIFGYNAENNKAGFISPRGSDQSYIFGSGLWFGAMKKRLDSTGTPILRPAVFITYNPNSGASWATPNEGGPITGPPTLLPKLYHSVDFNHATGENIVPTVPPAAPRKWPLWLKPGEAASTLFAGNFEPTDDYRTDSNGTYKGPGFMPGVDEQFVSRFHDKNLEQYEIGSAAAAERGYPLGLLIEQNVVGWKTGRYSEAVVLEYQIINTSGDTLFNCVAAQATDPDIGSASNDHSEYYAAKPELRATRVWTDREVRGAWGQLVSVLLEAPMVDVNGYVDNAHRADFRTSGRIGSYPAWTLANDPQTDIDRYNLMISGNLATDNGPDDQRTMLASPTFSLRPGDTVHFAVAYAVLHGTFGRAHGLDGIDPFLGKPSGIDDDTALEKFSLAITTDYYKGLFDSAPQASVDNITGATSGTMSLWLQPNPVRGATSIHYNLSDPAVVTLRVIDALGRTAATFDGGIGTSGENIASIDVSGLMSGAYTVVVEAAGKRGITRMIVAR